jgi:DNA-binding transcriptional MocR family regulator
MSKRGMTGDLAYRRVGGVLARLIANGTLRAGDRMPSVRELCRRERVSPATALQAYAELERSGLVEVRERSGHYVRERSRTARGADGGDAPRTLRPDAEPTQVGVSDEVARLLDQAADPGIVSLGTSVPAPELLPLAGLERAVTAAARRDPYLIGKYSFAGGHPGLRRVLAARFATLGCEAAPDEITITAGAMESLNLAVRAVTRPGDIVVVESPGYFGVLEIVESLGLKALPVPGDCEHGPDLRALAQALEDYPVKAVVLVTSFSNPTGSCMTPERRGELVELLADHGVPLIEDDIYGGPAFRHRAAAAGARLGPDGRGALLRVFLEDARAGPAARVGGGRALP